MKKGQVFLAALGLLIVGAITIGAFYFANRQAVADRFSVTGSGSVYAKADIANLTIGFRTETSKTAAEATKEATDKMNNILSEIKSLGIEEKDIKTTNYSLNPVYNWTEKDGQKLAGYEVSQNVSVKVRDLEKIGDIISKTTEQGANQIGGVSFTIDDEYELKNEARELAIEKAKEKAALIAAQAGMKLGKVTGFYENSSQPIMYDYVNVRKEMLAVEDLAGGLTSPSIEAGQNEIKVEVTLTYEVK